MTWHITHPSEGLVIAFEKHSYIGNSTNPMASSVVFTINYLGIPANYSFCLWLLSFLVISNTQTQCISSFRKQFLFLTNMFSLFSQLKNILLLLKYLKTNVRFHLGIYLKLKGITFYLLINIQQATKCVLFSCW